MESPRDTEVARPRSWKRRYFVGPDGSPDHRSWLHGPDTADFTILTGHDAVERIDREAYGRGREYGFSQGVSSMKDTEVIPSLSGVEPVVVEGFTWIPGDEFPWYGCIPHIDIYKTKAADSKPCLVAIWPGVGRDGKKVEG